MPGGGRGGCRRGAGGVPDDRPIVAGLAHQGESVLAWDARDGRALTPIVVWQDKRQLELLEGLDPTAVSRSGLPARPVLLGGQAGLADRRTTRPSSAPPRTGALRMGTVDAFLVDRLGGRFATDLSTASRTQLLALGGRDWDEQLLSTCSACAATGCRHSARPSAPWASCAPGRWPRALPLGAQLVDQQAALAGSGAVGPGEAKATYGTGVFVLARTGGPAEAHGLLPTVAWARTWRPRRGRRGHTRARRRRVRGGSAAGVAHERPGPGRRSARPGCRRRGGPRCRGRDRAAGPRRARLTVVAATGPRGDRRAAWGRASGPHRPGGAGGDRRAGRGHRRGDVHRSPDRAAAGRRRPRQRPDPASDPGRRAGPAPVGGAHRRDRPRRGAPGRRRRRGASVGRARGHAAGGRAGGRAAPRPRGASAAAGALAHVRVAPARTSSRYSWRTS